MSDIVITEQQIKDWVKRRAELQEKIREYGAEIDLLERRLQAIDLLGGETEKTPVEDTAVINIGDPTAPSVIYNILFNSRTRMSPKQIREKALETEFPPEKWGKGFAYLYTALKRLVDSEKIMRDNEGLYYVPLLRVIKEES